MAKKILIVDDEADVRSYIDALLKESGYETAIAADGDEAMDITKKFNPDLISLDIIMPHESGQKFYRDLCKDPQLKDIPVIILSGVTRYKELFARDHKTMPKPFAFIDKPIDRDLYLDKIREALK